MKIKYLNSDATLDINYQIVSKFGLNENRDKAYKMFWKLFSEHKELETLTLDEFENKFNNNEITDLGTIKIIKL